MENSPRIQQERDGLLEIRLLGEVEIRQNGHALSSFPTRKSRSVFALLVLERRKTHLRDQVSECFWPEAEPGRARAALRTELWRIRQLLKDSGLNPQHIIKESRETVRFNPDADCILDVETFDRALDACLAKAPTDVDVAALEAALGLYRADLLEGEYGDWCNAYRQHYRSRYISSLEWLMERAMQSNRWWPAVEIGNRLLSLDPLAEHIHRDMMFCYDAMGNRSAALRQYSRCSELLIQELAVSPMMETQALSEEIRTGGDKKFNRHTVSSEESSLHRARLALDEAVRRIDKVIIKFGQAEATPGLPSRTRS